jgi:hypothetical protein
MGFGSSTGKGEANLHSIHGVGRDQGHEHDLCTKARMGGVGKSVVDTSALQVIIFSFLCVLPDLISELGPGRFWRIRFLIGFGDDVNDRSLRCQK